jgi:hypothetical protein
LEEAHTRDILQIKAKDTQLQRTKRDLDVAQAQLAAVRKEYEQMTMSTRDVQPAYSEERIQRAEMILRNSEGVNNSSSQRLADLEQAVKSLDGGDALASVSQKCRSLEEQNRTLLNELRSLTLSTSSSDPKV